MDLGYDINKNKVKDPSYYWVPRRIKADLSNSEIAYLLEHRDEFKWLEVTEESIRTYEMDDDNKYRQRLPRNWSDISNAFSTETAKDIYKDNRKRQEYLKYWKCRIRWHRADVSGWASREKRVRNLPC